MELQYLGANCLRITTKKASLIVDDNLADLGLKTVAKSGDVILLTGPHATAADDSKLVIDQPGEYEVSDVSVQGIAARSHLDEAGQSTATVFRITADDIRLVITGHIYPELNDWQLEAIGTADVLIIPLGGNGYTMDGEGALAIIKKIEPKLVIPTHYADKALTYPVTQSSLEDVLKSMAMEPAQTVPKLKIKPIDLTDNTQLIVLERQ